MRRVLVPTRVVTLFVLVAQASTACRSDRVASRERTAGAPAAIADIAGKAQHGHPVIFLGLDAADWGLLDGYIARGVMPNLGRLVAEGTSGQVTTLSPALSPLVWTTMMTGTSPLEHGILDFLQFDPVTGQREPITSSERRVPAVWNMATAGGRRPAVFGLWATFPAEAVEGLIVSDRLFTFLYKEQAPPLGVVFPEDREGWARDGLARAERSADYDAVHRYLPWLTRSEYDGSLSGMDPSTAPGSGHRVPAKHRHDRPRFRAVRAAAPGRRQPAGLRPLQRSPRAVLSGDRRSDRPVPRCCRCGGSGADDRVGPRVLLGRGAARAVVERGHRERGQVACAAGHLSALGSGRVREGGPRA
ncbi:MAG: hypothetical protein DMF96_17355 [Acidobacteria bacterium]|nr:MAG: hypothetical protein DMF96_17355 [Acidobacteriota bacterium]